MYVYPQEEDSTYSTTSMTESATFYDNFFLLSLALLADSFHISVSSLIRALHKDHSTLSTSFFILGLHTLFYILTYALCYLFCYVLEMGLKGLWTGWLLGLLISCAAMGYKLFGK